LALFCGKKNNNNNNGMAVPNQNRALIKHSVARAGRLIMFVHPACESRSIYILPDIGAIAVAIV